jgi:hypothetical protein
MDARAGLAGINEHRHTRGSGHQFAQELQSLCHQLAREKIDACYIAAWPAEARDKTKLGRVFGERR